MNPRRCVMLVSLCVGLLCGALGGVPAMATTLNHTSVADFSGGLTTGGVAKLAQWAGNPPAGQVGILPAPDPASVLISDDFNETTAADAQAAGWLFTTANPTEGPQAPNLPQVLFSGDTATTPNASAPAAGFMRLHASRPQDLWDTNVVGQRSPLLAMNTTPVTGDFVAETKLTITTPRVAAENRLWGLIVLPTSAESGSPATGVTLDGSTPYYFLAVDQNNMLTQQVRAQPQGGVYANSNTTFTGETWYLRVVRRGPWFYCYARTSDTAPWIFQNYAKVPALASSSTAPVMIGFFDKSWGGVDATKTQYKDADFDFLHVNGILPSSLSGTYSNVFDAGALFGKAAWQSMNLDTFSIEGLRYQARGGNTLSNGTLTDAGDFVGPDGTASTYFTDETAQILPNFGSTRYLEYKLYLDATAPPATATDDALPTLADFPAVVKRVSATFNPAGLYNTYATAAADYGADAGGVQTQPGGGDLGLARTQAYLDDFTTAPLANNWTLDWATSIPSVTEWDTFDANDVITLGSASPGGAVQAVSSVKSADSKVTYAAGTDYTADTTAGTVTRLATGTIPAGAKVGISYTVKPLADANITDRAGWLAFKVGYPLDIWTGAGNKSSPRLLRPLVDQSGNPVDPNNFEIETEINAEQLQSYLAGLVVWQDTNNWVDMMLGRSNLGQYLSGVSSEVILNDSSSNNGRGGSNGNDGSHLMQLRITKHNQILTFSYRDMASPSPSWRTQKIQNTATLATGGADFKPTMVGLMVKHSAGTDVGPISAFFHYFKVSTLADTGSKDIALPAIPAGSTPDIITQATDQAGSTGAFTTKFQVKTTTGDFVGPDGTNATYFTRNVPKFTGIPVDLASPALRVFLDNTQPAGTPYVHAVGIQYAAPGTKIAHDTNPGDWVVDNIFSQAGQGTSALPAGTVDATVNPGLLQVTATSTTGAIIYQSRVFDFGGPVTTPVFLRDTASTLQVYFRAADTLQDLAQQPFVGPDAVSQPPAYSFTGSSGSGTFYLGNTDKMLYDASYGKRYFQYAVYFNQKTTATLASLNDMELVAQALPAVNTLGTATGTDIPARFGAASLLATQTVPTQFGNSTNANGSELDQLFAMSDGTNLNVGITGNIEPNGNGIILLLDTTSGGNSTINYTGTDASDRFQSVNGYTMDAGFTPDYAIDLGNAGSPATLYVDLYDLGANTKTYLGGIPDGSGGALTGGGSAALDNSNTAGVGDTSAANASSATSGLEISIPLSQIGNPSGQVRLMAVVVGGKYTSNQMLPGLPDTTGNLGSGAKDLSGYVGQQYASLGTQTTGGDLALSNLKWTYTPVYLTGSADVDPHPPVVSTPTVYNGRAYVVEDVAHSDGTHTGNLAAINVAPGPTPTATLATDFGGAGPVALDAPVTGRVAVTFVGGAARLYAMTTKGTLYMMDAADGGHEYSIKPLGTLDATSSSTPAVIEDLSATPVNGQVYVGVKDTTGGRAYVARVLDNATSEPTLLGTQDIGTDVTSSPSLVAGGTRVQIGAINGAGGTVYTLNQDLTPVLGVATTNPVKAPTIVSGDYTQFFVGDAPATGDGAFYSFDSSTGALLWQTGANSVPAISGGVDQSAFLDYLVKPNVVYFGTTTGQLQARNAADGSNATAGFPRPTTFLGSKVTGTPLLLKPATDAVDGNLYVPTSNGMFLVNTATPTVRQRYPVSPGGATPGMTMPAATGRAAGSIIAVGNSNGTVNGLAAQ